MIPLKHPIRQCIVDWIEEVKFGGEVKIELLENNMWVSNFYGEDHEEIEIPDFVGYLKDDKHAPSPV